MPCQPLHLSRLGQLVNTTACLCKYDPTLNSLGLPGVSTSQTPDVFIQNCQKKLYGGFSARLQYIERKSATSIEATTKPRGGYRYLPFTVAAYLFLAKIIPGIPQTAKQRYTVDFPPVYGTMNENQLLRAQQNQEEVADIPFPVTLYLFLEKSTMPFFIVTWFLTTCVLFFIMAWFLTTYVFCGSSKKPGATHTSTK